MFFFTKNQFEKAVAEEVNKQTRGAKSLIEDTDAVATMGGTYKERQLIVSFDDMWQMYLRNDWVRACVDKITKSATNSNLFVEPIKKEGEEQPSDDAKAHADEINKLLEDPNTGLESWKDIRREYLRDVLIYDSGAIEIVFDEGNDQKPAELYSLPGQKIRLNVDDRGNFRSEEEAFYEVGGYVNGKKVDDIPFARRELVYMVANPKSGSMYGLSPLESLYMAVTSDLFASKYNADFFKNNAEASGILGLEGMSLADLNRFRAYWRAETKGKPHKVVAVNNKVNWTPLNLTNRDMQFLEYQKWLLCKIMAVYGMQPVVLGVIDPTTGKLNSSEQLQAYREDTIRPLLELETYQLTKVLVQQGFGYDDVKVSYEPIDIKDEVQQAQTAVQLVNGRVITPNEARRMYLGLKEIDGGDKLMGDTSSPTQPELGLPETKPQQAIDEAVKNINRILKKLE